jgi:hypothetical protein|tara:strand:+ start:124 stop:435 length:312 start_codon:yes stop_codon:yes gene_type:complete
MSVKAWNDEEEAELIKLYKEQDEKDVIILATHFSKGYRSVISKLVQLKIYEKPRSDENRQIMTVKTMLRDIESLLDIQIEGTNLNKKSNLVNLVTALKEQLAK